MKASATAFDGSQQPCQREGKSSPLWSSLQGFSSGRLVRQQAHFGPRPWSSSASSSPASFVLTTWPSCRGQRQPAASESAVVPPPRNRSPTSNDLSTLPRRTTSCHHPRILRHSTHTAACRAAPLPAPVARPPSNRFKWLRSPARNWLRNPARSHVRTKTCADIISLHAIRYFRSFEPPDCRRNSHSMLQLQTGRSQFVDSCPAKSGDRTSIELFFWSFAELAEAVSCRRTRSCELNRGFAMRKMTGVVYYTRQWR